MTHRLTACFVFVFTLLAMPLSHPGLTVKMESASCSAAEVINYTVEGGGHTWPGGAQMMIGPVNRDFEASHAIVEFLSRH